MFPKKWCVDNRVDDLRRERIVNKTAIAATTNRKIGGRAPSKYLPLLQKEAETTREELRRRVEQHHVDFDALEGDNFDTHFERRRQRLLDLIGEAMGKDIAIPAIPSLPEDFDLDEEEPSDDDIAEEDS